MRKRIIAYPEINGEMARHGETLKDLAKVLGIGVSAMSQKLTGKIKFNEPEVRILCVYYNRDYFDLFRKGE